MKKIWIIKTGSTYPELKAQQGDFEDWILDHMDIDKKDTIVYELAEKNDLPDGFHTRGIVITGSHANVTENKYWMEQFSQWIQAYKSTQIPVLGICFGHQLLAHAFGGKVDFHPRGKEIGSAHIHINEEGREDPLLSVLPPIFTGFVTHSQTLIELPEKSVKLASNSFEHTHAFRNGKNIWGVQFHPEFNARITKYYIEQQKDDLIAQGLKPEEVYESVTDNDYGKILLRKFKNLYKEK